MELDYGRLSVERVVLHDVPLAPLGVVLSEGETDLDQALANYFDERLRMSLRKGFDIEPDPESASTTPVLIRGILDTPSELVSTSQRLAQHLHSVQKAPVSPGLLVVAVTRIGDGRRGLALLKLERESGMRAERGTNQTGERAFTVDLIKSLIFTDRLRVFKAALFIPSGTSIAGRASDHQAGHDVADLAFFFLRTFLGCRLAVAPETATRDWYELTESFINARVADAVDKTTYQLAALTELKSNSPQIDARQFATAYFKTEHRQPYLRFLGEQGVATEGLVKSLALLKNATQRVLYDFRSGIRVLADPDMIGPDKPVTVEDADLGRTKLSIVDALNRIRSGGR